jgi:hypothetical protein
MLRHSPGASGGRQSRTKWPALASSAARTASAARNSSTLTGLVPSGTVVTRSMRYSMGLVGWVELKCFLCGATQENERSNIMRSVVMLKERFRDIVRIMKNSTNVLRIRLAAISLTLSGIFFVLYPTIRPFSN